MSKRKGKSKSNAKAQPRSGWPKFLVPGLLVVAMLVGGGTWFFLQKSSPQTAAAQYTGGARLWVDSDYIDFGNVRFEKFVTARFRLRNVGDQPLRLAVDRTVEAIEGC
ncbi:MAG: hypothetical protein ACHQ7N_15870 [Candidatus Methylomirabilales bacterium]